LLKHPGMMGGRGENPEGFGRCLCARWEQIRFLENEGGYLRGGTEKQKFTWFKKTTKVNTMGDQEASRTSLRSRKKKGEEF